MTNNIIQTYFFDLIKVATENINSLSGIPTPNEWKEIYILAKKQTLVHITKSKGTQGLEQVENG